LFFHPEFTRGWVIHRIKRQQLREIEHSAKENGERQTFAASGVFFGGVSLW